MSKNLGNKLSFKEAKKNGRPLILDGAMGSLLQQYNVPVDSHIWMSKANIDYPEIIKDIYHQYIEAGADIITTNTFRTNPVAVNNSDLNSEELVKQALSIAQNSVQNTKVIIAGSNPPAEDCYQIERTLNKDEIEKNHKEHIDLLLKYGSDFILNETQSHLDEIEIICKYCYSNQIQYVLSLFVNDELKILSGEDIKDVIDFIHNYNPLAIGFNCTTISTFLDIYKNIELNFSWGLYLNCGDGSFSDVNIKCGVSPTEYAQVVKNILDKTPLFVGACCGSSPEHIKKLKVILDG
ncbi:MAG: homocysteine S-methyltransferase family protein [Bacteroidetes bacterium]|nr:homocysteine S-methyltransferase family protein [Bacteroidota bacterium]